MAYEVYEPWKHGVRGAIGEEGTVPGPVDVSPPAQRGVIDRMVDAAPGIDVWRDTIDQARNAPNLPAATGQFARGALAAGVGGLVDVAKKFPGLTIANELGGHIAKAAYPFFTGENLPSGSAAGAAPRKPASQYPQGSADSQAARLGVNRGGQVDNFGPGLVHNVPQRAAPTATAESGGGTLDERLSRMRDELAMYRAREDMGQQQKLQAMQANANWATDWTAKRDAANAARSANFRATNGADMVLASGAREYEGQRQAIQDAAKMENANLAIAEGNLQKSQAGLMGQPRNYVEEMAKGMREQGLNTVARSRTIDAQTRAGAAEGQNALYKAQAEGAKLNNEQHQKILNLANLMSSAKTPEDAMKAKRQIFAMIGKNIDDYDIKSFGGGTTTNASGFPEKAPDQVAIISKETGKVEMVLGGNQAVGANGVAPPGMKQVGVSPATGKPVYEDKDGKRLTQP